MSTTHFGYNLAGLSKVSYLVGKNKVNSIRRLMFRTIFMSLLTVYALFGILLFFKNSIF
jgi:Na+-driven multidrug efflux pump